MNKLYPEIEAFIKTLPGTTPLTARRQKMLQEVSAFIYKKQQADDVAELVFICTHNSRRSHFAQLWAAIAAHYHGIENVLTFSGGTEATAFHPNAVAAMERAGCKIQKGVGNNPVYLVKFSDSHPGCQAFSKKYGDKYNPKNKFCAVMTCTDADEACPVVLGMEKRVSLTYDDPKISDGTKLEAQRYDERCRQIAMEMFYMISHVGALSFH